jgi:hypothetical protein
VRLRGHGAVVVEVIDYEDKAGYWRHAYRVTHASPVGPVFVGEFWRAVDVDRERPTGGVGAEQAIGGSRTRLPPYRPSPVPTAPLRRRQVDPDTDVTPPATSRCAQGSAW